MTQAGSDRRREERRAEERRPAEGEVRLRPAGTMAGMFTGALLDVSTGGFRIRHRRLNLASGDLVQFEFQGRSGAAKAIWNRIVGAEAETGFSVITEP